MSIGGRLGARIGGGSVALFGEANGRFVLEVADDDLPAVVAALHGEALDIGEVLDEPVLEIADATIPLADAVTAYFGAVR